MELESIYNVVMWLLTNYIKYNQLSYLQIFKRAHNI